MVNLQERHFSRDLEEHSRGSRTSRRRNKGIVPEKFQKGNSRLYLEKKLRARIQGEEECPLASYYDVINMCLAYRTMLEKEIL